MVLELSAKPTLVWQTGSQTFIEKGKYVIIFHVQVYAKKRDAASCLYFWHCVTSTDGECTF